MSFLSGVLKSAWSLQGCAQEVLPRDVPQLLVPSGFCWKSVSRAGREQPCGDISCLSLGSWSDGGRVAGPRRKQKQTFSLIPIVSAHCLLWFKVPGLQRHGYQTDIPRARGSLPLVPAGRVLNCSVQGLGSPGTLS